MFGSFKVVEKYHVLDDKVKTVVVKVARRRANGEQGEGKVKELSYGNFKGTDQGNVKLLFEGNVQRSAAGSAEGGNKIK
jgi:hypothetical protein